MDLNDTGRRMVGQHWRLILLFVAAGLVVGWLAAAPGGTLYTASARLGLDMPDPQTQAESQVIADTGEALATSPGLVADALASARIRQRSALDIARNHVSAHTLGTSGVLELSVSDRDPQVAARLSNALANAIISARQDITRGATRRALAGLDERIAGLNVRISRLDARVEQLNRQAVTSTSLDTANALRAQRDAASRTRDLLAAQLTVFQAERDRLESANALQPQAAVVSPATPPAHADSPALIMKLVLGLLLGLILGVGSAALVETLRPTLVGGDALAGEFALPLLAQLSSAPGEPLMPDEVGRVAERLRLAAESAHVRRLCLVGVGPDLDVDPLAKLLDNVMQTETSGTESEPELAAAPSALPHKDAVRPMQGARSSRHGHPTIRVSPVDFRNSPLANGGGTGLVLVSERVLKRAELADSMLLLRVSPVPTLGLIAYGRSRKEAHIELRNLVERL